MIPWICARLNHKPVRGEWTPTVAGFLEWTCLCGAIAYNVSSQTAGTHENIRWRTWRIQQQRAVREAGGARP